MTLQPESVNRRYPVAAVPPAIIENAGNATNATRDTPTNADARWNGRSSRAGSRCSRGRSCHGCVESRRVRHHPDEACGIRVEPPGPPAAGSALNGAPCDRPILRRGGHERDAGARVILPLTGAALRGKAGSGSALSGAPRRKLGGSQTVPSRHARVHRVHRHADCMQVPSAVCRIFRYATFPRIFIGPSRRRQPLRVHPCRSSFSRSSSRSRNARRLASCASVCAGENPFN